MPLPPDFKVEDEAPRVQYTASGGNTEFAYTWPIFATTDLDVFVNGVAQTEGAGNDYTVTGNGAGETGINQEGGGKVVFESGLTGGDVVTVVRDIAIARTSDFVQGGPLRARQLNDQLDKLIGMLQQLEMNIARSLRVPVTSDFLSTLSTDLPTPEANKLLGWNSAGTAIQNLSLASSVASNPWLTQTPTIAVVGTSATVTYTLKKIEGGVDTGASSTDDGVIAGVSLSDSTGSASPSTTAAISGSSVLDGVGTATAIVKQGSDGTIEFTITGTASSSVYVRIEAAAGSSRLLLDKDGANAVTFA